MAALSSVPGEIGSPRRSRSGHRNDSRHRSRPLSRGRARRDGPHGQGAALRADRDRLLLHREPRHRAREDREHVRRGEALPRPAGREEARTQARPAQYRLSPDARQYAAHLDRPDRHQGQPQRGLLREARDGAGPSRRAVGPPLPRPQPLARPAGLPRHRRRLLQRDGAAGAEDGAALRARPRPAGQLFRHGLLRADVLDAHDALPAAGRARRRRIWPGAAHRHQLPHPAGAQRGAGPVDPQPERQLDRHAGDRQCLCRERRADAAALHQRPVPGDAAPRHQQDDRRALCAALLLRQRHRLAGRRRADDGRPRQAAEISDDLVQRLHDLVPEAELRRAERSAQQAAE